MKKLIDYTKILRSKNAGPLFITFDLIFNSKDDMEYVKLRLKKSDVAKVYNVDEDKIEKASDFKVGAGDLLIAMTGATIGKFTMVPHCSETLLVNQRVGKFFLGNNPIEKLPFIYCTLKQPDTYNDANQTLTFDAVKVVATGVTGTYLIGLDGNNSDLNLLNGSEILIENTTALDLDVICVNASTGNDIVVENSKVNVTNLDGRVFFRGNYTVKDSEVSLAGITKAGFRIEAGQTLSIGQCCFSNTFNSFSIWCIS